jgi:hypothetical protein
MVTKPFSIDTREFPTKGSAHEFFREMLHRYRAAQRVNDIDSLDLSALLMHHTDYTEKVGIGIANFKVAKNIFRTNSFWIVRTDGSEDDFSFQHCITPKS